MTIMDPIGDMLTRIRNGGRVKALFVRVPYSRFKQSLLDLFYREGYIRGYQVLPSTNELCVLLKYMDGIHVIQRISRISRPGCRRYLCYEEILRNKQDVNGLATTVLSTTKGVLSAKEAHLLRVGGEVLCIIK